MASILNSTWARLETQAHYLIWVQKPPLVQNVCSKHLYGPRGWGWKIYSSLKLTWTVLTLPHLATWVCSFPCHSWHVTIGMSLLACHSGHVTLGMSLWTCYFHSSTSSSSRYFLQRFPFACWSGWRQYPHSKFYLLPVLFLFFMFKEQVPEQLHSLYALLLVRMHFLLFHFVDDL